MEVERLRKETEDSRREAERSSDPAAQKSASGRHRIPHRRMGQLAGIAAAEMTSLSTKYEAYFEDAR
jgi:hypothetical protein